MSGLELLLIGLAALIGSAVTALAGLGGGSLLVSVLLQFLTPLPRNPRHPRHPWLWSKKLKFVGIYYT